MGSKFHPIGYVSRVTGLSPHLIRAWERRYGAVCPDRSRGNRRLYSDDDIRRLTALQRGVEAGHRIAQLSAMEPQVLNRLAGRFPNGGPSASPQDRPAAADDHLSTCLEAVSRLDAARLETALSEAAAELPRRRFLEQVVTPLMNGLGDRWSEGRSKILHEHLASTVVQSFLWDLLRSASQIERRPSIVAATPAGQWCSLGALVVAISAADLGWNAHFFGPNLPAEEIAAAVRGTGASAVALSLTCSVEASHFRRELRRLHQGISPHVTLCVGGRGAVPLEEVVSSVGGRCVPDLSSFLSILAGTSPAEEDLSG
jgi:DNA-binding transcriptional MerR regulator